MSLSPRLLFVEPDSNDLCLNVAYQLTSVPDYIRYRQKPVFQERFHHAQIVLASPVISLSRRFPDSEVQTLLTKTRNHLLRSPVFQKVDLDVTDVRLLLLHREISRAKTRDEYAAHPLAKTPY